MQDPSKSVGGDNATEPAPPCYIMHEAEGSAGFVSICKGGLMHVTLPGADEGKDGIKDPGSSKPSATHHDAWTLTMDIKIDSLPEYPQSILSCSPNANALIQTTRDETETLLYPMGALSIFDEMPQEGAGLFKPGQWNRVSIRYGYEPEIRKKGGGPQPSGMASFLRAFPHISSVGGGHGGGKPRKRKLWVYINGASHPLLVVFFFSQSFHAP